MTANKQKKLGARTVCACSAAGLVPGCSAPCLTNKKTADRHDSSTLHSSATAYHSDRAYASLRMHLLLLLLYLSPSLLFACSFSLSVFPSFFLSVSQLFPGKNNRQPHPWQQTLCGELRWQNILPSKNISVCNRATTTNYQYNTRTAWYVLVPNVLCTFFASFFGAFDERGLASDPARFCQSIDQSINQSTNQSLVNLLAFANSLSIIRSVSSSLCALDRSAISRSFFLSFFLTTGSGSLSKCLTLPVWSECSKPSKR